MNYQDYIWDLGGTLLDNYETSTAAFVHTLQDFGLHASHDEVYKALKVSTDYAVRQFAPTNKDFLKTYKANEAKELEQPILFDGASELLAQIIQQGGRNFLISHRDDQVLEILRKTQISAYFTEVVTSGNGFKRKPDPESMLYLKDKYQIQSGLVIGDRPIDIEAGQAAGFATYLFDDMKNLEKFVDIELEKE
ncbi:HAD-IA family hydrolase [Streptococcus sinensis]|uniref:HAD-IA family hydrolase n=1 Tax=Streptococcus sinensis TaxID=176090 RepID=UPI001C2E19DF|nr:HAD-IA family hydrolase [Streptococcus sinensis]MCD1276862.1 hydrolase [Streptococcus sinensis]MCF1284690.1 HAD-IA family hydrolase [Streptococcus sinensis]